MDGYAPAPAGLMAAPDDQGLALLDGLGRPIWIYDLDDHVLTWGNRAALALWGAADLDALRARGADGRLSAEVRRRLDGYATALCRGERVSAPFTFYPGKEAVRADCLLTGLRLADGHTGMLVEATPLPSDVEASVLRGLEALRHTRAMVTLFDADGSVLYQNQAARDAFGPDDAAPGFGDRFADAVAGESRWVEALARPETSGWAAFETRHGQRWHSVETRQARDPTTGRLAILAHQLDVTEQRAAEDARNTLLEILEATPDFISLADIDRSVLYLSAGARRMLNLPASKPGRFGFDIPDGLTKAGDWLHPDWASRKVISEGIPTALREGSWTGMTALRDGAGREIPVSQVIIAHANRAGTVERISTIMRDVRELQEARHDAEEAAARLRRVLRVSPAGIFAIGLPRGADERPRLHVLSQEVETLTGIPRRAWAEDPIGVWRSLIHPDDLPAVLDRQGDLFETGRLVHEYRIRHADGHWLWILDTVAVAFDAEGQPTELTGSWLDITARRQIEAELRRSNEDLEQFAYVASHDLQEPLRMVSGYVSLIRRRLGDSMTPELAEFIDLAVDGARRMQGMVNDLLQYSRVQTRGAPLAHTETEQALEDAMASLGRLIAESGARVTQDRLPPVWGDRQQVARVFQNLLGNALKYRHPDRRPEIAISVEPANTFWRFHVSDNGIGIPAGQEERIFNIFQRLHPHETDDSATGGGSGIGLAICKRIVERDGGDIAVTSVEGAGATFSFTLPAAH